ERKEILDKAGITYEEGGHTSDKFVDAYTVIKSPGIPKTAPIISFLEEHEIPIISEIEFACRFTRGYIIAITGTNGKTTTASLTYHILKTNGLDVKLAGNIGKSFAMSLVEGDADYFVLEVSSFQLDDIDMFHPNISVILNVTPDHLDRYNNSMYEYTSAKIRITENQKRQDLFIYNAKDYWTSQNLQNLIGNPQMMGINLKRNGQKIIHWDEEAHTLQVRDHIFDLTKLSLHGEHNYFNTAVAVLAAQRLKLSEKEIALALRTFKGSPHRMEKITNINSIAFYNDSKGTNVDATSKALKSFKENIIWIAGGVDKGNNYRELERLVRQRVHAVVALGTQNEKLIEFFKPHFGDRLVSVASMQEAVLAAYRFAPEDGTILLSPACASFDLFKNYEHRGEEFRKHTLELAHAVPFIERSGLRFMG
ncbi:MAG: UDP-N-acetylmuramoyl-L-alanine--D-glutamate ligase, partial [Bacteroidota bacterium]